LTFQLHCSSLGIELLSDDIKFIKSQLLRLPRQDHKGILSKYAQIWVDSMIQCDNVIRQQNIGRRNANNYIRELGNGTTGRMQVVQRG